MPEEEFTANRISEFLQDRQRSGRSSWYRRSLRNALKAIYRFGRKNQTIEEIRAVKLEYLEPQSWTPEEVTKLVSTCGQLPERERLYWRTLIATAYYTGFNACDLHRLEKQNILPNGNIPFSRRKTRKRVFVGIPLCLVEEIYAFAPESGPIWPLSTSKETFRLKFKELVRLAAIPPGTFKRLRKTSGTLVELAAPGMGHQHLGNERRIFDVHYNDPKVTKSQATMPVVLKIS